MEEYRWYPVEEKEHPNKQGIYKCTLNDGNVYNIRLSHYANGWFWEIEREIKIHFQVWELGEPKVIAWFPNPKPYISNL